MYFYRIVHLSAPKAGKLVALDQICQGPCHVVKGKEDQFVDDGAGSVTTS
jgi:hypothetical protein